MHKVVYNAGYGGFGLSKKAVNWLKDNCTDSELRHCIESAFDEFKKSTCPLKEEFLCADIGGWFCGKRHHKDLVAVVEALGDKASGFCASLDIMKTDSNQYLIKEYDGAEEVITPDGDERWIFIED